MAVKYPHITVALTGRVDGNANSIIGAVAQELRRNKVPQTEIDEFRREARSGDYQHVWNTVFDTVEVD